jgi:hypothetical protein
MHERERTARNLIRAARKFGQQFTRLVVTCWPLAVVQGCRSPCVLCVLLWLNSDARRPPSSCHPAGIYLNRALARTKREYTSFADSSFKSPTGA